MSKEMADIAALKRSFTLDHFYGLLADNGLECKGTRFACPSKQCRSHNPSDLNAQLYEGQGGVQWKCFRCNAFGDYINLVQRLHGIDFMQALSMLEARGITIPTKSVDSIPERAGPSQQEMARLAEQLADTDEEALAYLASRGLTQCLGMKFATGECHNYTAARMGREGYRIAVPLYDVLGQLVSWQYRASRDVGKMPTKMSHPRVKAGDAFFGEPHRIEAAQTFAIFEGMADTLAGRAWAPEEIAVVGAAGKSNLLRLGKQLEAASIPIRGKTAYLFPQNDTPPNGSRLEFMRLAKILSANGCIVQVINTPIEYDDVADWRQKAPTAPWPAAPEPRKMLEARGPFVALEEVIAPDKNLQTLLGTLLDERNWPALWGAPEPLRMNEMKGRIELGSRTLEDYDITSIRTNLEAAIPWHGKTKSFGHDDARRGIVLAAWKNSYHPVADYLNGLQWDGKDRIEELAWAVLRREPAELESKLLRKWLMAAVRRVLRPGIKMDTSLVLAGPKGIYKSSFFQQLASPEWFSDTHIDLYAKDAKQALQYVWIYEWAEMEQLARAKYTETVKSFLTSGSDNYRKPYAAEYSTNPRRCVIVGTTNEDSFIQDEALARRLWILDLNSSGKRIDLDWVADNRDQLWAQAAELATTDEWHHLTAEEEAELELLQEPFMYHDLWEEEIAKYMQGKTETTINDILVNCLSKSPGNLGRAEQMRVARSLKALGYVKVRAGSGGSRQYVYRHM